MNFLILQYTTLGYPDLISSIQRLGHLVSVISYMPNSFEEDPKLEEYLTNRFTKETFDAVISFDYFQVVAKVCFAFHTKYISWVWDSPMLTLYSETTHFPTNYIFLFDQNLLEHMKSLGVNTVYHMELAVNTERLSQIKITNQDLEKYSDTISFVGRLYYKKISYDSMKLSPYLRGYLDAVIQTQARIAGENLMEELILDPIMELIESQVQIYLGDKFTGKKKKVFSDFFMGGKATQIERKNILALLAQMYPVTIYTDDEISDIPELLNKGFVPYETEMPKVFSLSKINLNMTHKAIQTGIPLRVLDVLGAGGFLITNYQKEIADRFIDGEDLVIYYNEKDLLQKVSYYLQNDEERNRIAQNGHEKVKKYFTYEQKFNEMLQIAFGETKAEEEH